MFVCVCVCVRACVLCNTHEYAHVCSVYVVLCIYYLLRWGIQYLRQDTEKDIIRKHILFQQTRNHLKFIFICEMELHTDRECIKLQRGGEGGREGAV